MASKVIRWDTEPPKEPCTDPLGHRVEAQFTLGAQVPSIAVCVNCGQLAEVVITSQDENS